MLNILDLSLQLQGVFSLNVFGQVASMGTNDESGLQLLGLGLLLMNFTMSQSTHEYANGAWIHAKKI
jgi:hypothetical protein